MIVSGSYTALLKAMTGDAVSIKLLSLDRKIDAVNNLSFVVKEEVDYRLL
ncbi:MAG: hypothetical protein ACLRQF_00805 [Thomasclavelia ramosa]